MPQGFQLVKLALCFNNNIDHDNCVNGVRQSLLTYGCDAQVGLDLGQAIRHRLVSPHKHSGWGIAFRSAHWRTMWYRLIGKDGKGVY